MNLCLWKDLLKQTGWWAKPLELIEVEQLQLTTVSAGSLTEFSILWFFMMVLIRRHLQGHLIMESQQVIGVLIPLLRTDVGRGYRDWIDRTATDDWLDILQDFKLA